jgi:hypothetical protein
MNTPQEQEQTTTEDNYLDDDIKEMLALTEELNDWVVEDFNTAMKDIEEEKSEEENKEIYGLEQEFQDNPELFACLSEEPEFDPTQTYESLKKQLDEENQAKENGGKINQDIFKTGDDENDICDVPTSWEYQSNENVEL